MTCQGCGKPGKMREWGTTVLTACNVCWKEFQMERGIGFSRGIGTSYDGAILRDTSTGFYAGTKWPVE